MFLFVLSIPWSAALGESWFPAYELPGGHVDIDQQSILRSGQLVSWRERQVMADSVRDDGSWRMIREVQWRKQADCRKREMKVLSRAAFSENDALVDYAGAQPAKVVGRAFSSLLPAERKSVEALCNSSPK